MTAIYLCLSVLAALGFYLSNAHQRLWLGARALRVAAWVATATATVAAIAALGPWAGVFAVLTAVMLVLVLLPYLDAWRQLQRENRDVG
ncbi:hypothetical protein [Rhodanobacter sp. UC4436_H3]